MKMDKLDFLIEQGSEPQKVSRAFNISQDVAEALEKLKTGSRSKFVDLALRMVLEEKGLLTPMSSKRKTTAE